MMPQLRCATSQTAEPSSGAVERARSKAEPCVTRRLPVALLALRVCRLALPAAALLGTHGLPEPLVRAVRCRHARVAPLAQVVHREQAARRQAQALVRLRVAPQRRPAVRLAQFADLGLLLAVAHRAAPPQLLLLNPPLVAFAHERRPQQPVVCLALGPDGGVHLGVGLAIGAGQQIVGAQEDRRVRVARAAK